MASQIVDPGLVIEDLVEQALAPLREQLGRTADADEQKRMRNQMATAEREIRRLHWIPAHW